MKKLLFPRLTQLRGYAGAPMPEIGMENPVGGSCAPASLQQNGAGWTTAWDGKRSGHGTSPTAHASESRKCAEAFAHGQAGFLPEITGIVDRPRFLSEQTPEGNTIRIPGFGTDKAIESVYWMSLDLRVTTKRLREIANQLTQTPPKPSDLDVYTGRVVGYVTQFRADPTYGPGSFLRPGDSRFRKVGKVKVTLDASNIIFQDANLPAPEHQLKLLFRHDVFPKFVSVIVQAAAKTDVWARLTKVA